MRFLVDENCPAAVVHALRAAGHDLYLATAAAPGAADEDLAQTAIEQDRIVVTQDYDFGDLAVRARLPIPGVLLLAVERLRPPERASRVIAAVEALGQDLFRHLTIVEPQRLRRRRLR